MSEGLVRVSNVAATKRRFFIGGSDARIVMGSDEAALLRLWREKRGEVEPEDLSGNLIVQLGAATEELNRSWYERNTGSRIRDIQRRVAHPTIRWMAATLDGIVEGTEAVFESKFMLPWSFSEETAAEKYMAQLQHNMWVTHLRTSVLSIITGGGKWVEITIPVDPLYLSILVSAEKKFWRCVQSGEPPQLVFAEPPPRPYCGSSNYGYELLQFLGGVCSTVPQHTPGVPRPRTRQIRAQVINARRCAGVYRAWRAGKTFQIRCREL